MELEGFNESSPYLGFYAIQGIGPKINRYLFKRDDPTPKHNIFLLGSKLVSILEAIHSQGYVYNNLKLENVVTAKNSTTKDKSYECFRDESLFLLEFGLATPYIDFKTGKHLK